MNPLLAQKRLLRAELRQRRNALPASERLAASKKIREGLLGLPELSSATWVFCFISSGDEVGTHRLIDALVERGKQVLVPWIPAGGDMVAVHFPGWDGLAPGQLGILTPVAPRPHEGRVDLCITPGLGFTIRGERIGYGRGYYDRWFASHETGCRLGIAFECQIVDRVPVNETDVVLDILLTEARLIVTGALGGG